MQTKAIVTLVIGKHYRDRWHKLCAANWRKYAESHGYDLICIDTPLDNSPRAQSRSAAWQKCLILSDERVKKYDRVVWIDSDILINPNSPCIFSQVPEDKIGATDTFAGLLSEPLPRENGKQQLVVDRVVQFWNWSFRTGKEFYARVGLPDSFDGVVQTGVMVLSPRYHREILEHTYYNYEGKPGEHFEMESLSYEIVKANCIYWIDSRFNRMWIECMVRDYPFLLPQPPEKNRIVRIWKRLMRKGQFQLPPRQMTASCLTTALINNYFLHFAGTAQYMPWVNTKIKSWQELSGML